jgi:hypothetical protein
MPIDADDKKHIALYPIKPGAIEFIQFQSGSYAVRGRLGIAPKGGPPLPPVLLSHAKLVMQPFQFTLAPQTAYILELDVIYTQSQTTQANLQVAMLRPDTMKPIFPPMALTYHGSAANPTTFDRIIIYSRTY